MFLVLLYLFGLIFKVYEDFYYLESNRFDNLWNDLWYIIVTVTTSNYIFKYLIIVGFGDFVPTTIVGRIIGVFVCIVGVFLLSLLVVASINYTKLDNDEDKAYKDIEVVCTQNQHINFFKNYFDAYIKYKVLRLKKKFQIKDFFIKKNQFKIQKELSQAKVIASIQKEFEINQFCKNVKGMWNENIYFNKCFYLENSDKVNDSLDPLIDNIKDHISRAKSSKMKAFKMCNFAKIMSSLGSQFEMKSNIV
jgi:hypothetical protein